MATCGRCVPWNLPLMMPSHRSAFGALVPMTYQDGLWYHLHVTIHQKDNWAGEIDQPDTIESVHALAQTLERH